MGYLVRIAVLPWGDPSAWRYASYCYECFCKEGFSTLEFLVHTKELFPDLALVFVLDTLAMRLPTQSYRSYSELVERVREYVGRYICGRDRVQTNVEVLPGVMGCGGEGKIEFRANPVTTRLLTLYTLYFSILDLARCFRTGDGVEIVLDTTHGINYFSILVRESVLEVAAMVAAALGTPVKVSVFNADPMPTSASAPARSEKDPCEPSSAGPTPRLEYNLIGEYWVYPWDLVRYFRYSVDSVGKLISDPRECRLDEGELERLLSISKLAVASFRVGALVELVELVKRELDFTWLARAMLEKVHGCWLRKAGLVARNECRSTSFTKLQEGFRLLLHAHAVFSGVSRVLASAIGVDGVSLKYLRGLVEKLLEGSEVTITLVRDELNRVEARLSRERKGEAPPLPQEWVSYSQLMREEGVVVPEVECGKPVDYDPQKLVRVFVAHAGFLKDVVELRKVDDEDVVFRVRSECWGVVEKALEGVFNSLCSKFGRTRPSVERGC
ncbi:MAG: TM1812 family CRISPR-associated protein [Sulfolobales archaeon]